MIITSRDFAKALCKHFNLPPDKMSWDDIQMHTRLDEIFSVSITIAMDGSDVEAIGRLMAAEHAEQQSHV